MDEKKMVKKRLILFVTLTIIIAWLVFSLIPICGQTYGSVFHS